MPQFENILVGDRTELTVSLGGNTTFMDYRTGMIHANAGPW
jgi:hypothetical protein